MMVNVLIVLVLVSSTVSKNYIMDNIRLGLSAADNGDCNKAIYHFYKAVAEKDDGKLASISKAKIYWNMYLCASKIEDLNQATTYLIGFITNLDVARSESRGTGSASLRAKEVHAKVSLDALWARHNKYSCRSRMFDCRIDNSSDILLYKDVIPFCDGKISLSDNNTVANVECQDGSKQRYYFKRI